ncbi:MULTISPECIES: helix-turn-helix domain-containing protein [unclassified Pseudoalteromonas]|uniref:helix-turn-helix domain-containing protein n=1 Tax=unclassified Pseudoalteromonas TaxID=194690 RepID=UPI001F3A1B04|nr:MULTISPECIES: helix-turn-helix domain-containing protein [unclassified Pseudoalteromonas]MCF2826806.1 helix-turn-helix domain-containing protein [Pseudoalteromonas sp. OF5H-5]MCF2833639.1 helix-turn-helix domain-containing protein [Pseudoalteromonas sp. DL2-H6]MCF2926668.1 helix-turn-helix domain-containing protein [Pseudoalteromonas sp. DL2-H1]
MNLAEWFKSQKDSAVARKELGLFLGRSEAAVMAYTYGYRKAPDEVIEKIAEFTGGEVTMDDIKTQHQVFKDKEGSFAFSSLKGQRLGRPIVSVCKSSTQDEKVSFMAAIANEIALEVGV